MIIQKKTILCFIIMYFFVSFSPAKAQNTRWRCIKNKNGIQVYSKTMDSSKYMVIRVKTQLKTSLSSLVTLVSDAPNQISWVYLNRKAIVLKQKNAHSYILYGQSNAPWPITDRDVISSTEISQDSITGIVSVDGKALPRYIPVSPHYVRVPYALSQWQFIPKKNGFVGVVYTLIIDVGGSIPRWLANLTMAKGPYQTMLGLRKEIKRKKYREAHLSFIKEPGYHY